MSKFVLASVLGLGGDDLHVKSIQNLRAPLGGNHVPVTTNNKTNPPPPIREFGYLVDLEQVLVLEARAVVEVLEHYADVLALDPELFMDLVAVRHVTSTFASGFYGYAGLEPRLVRQQGTAVIAFVTCSCRPSCR